MNNILSGMSTGTNDSGGYDDMAPPVSNNKQPVAKVGIMATGDYGSPVDIEGNMPKGDTISQTAASAIGTGASLASTIAGGVLQGNATKDAREQAESNAYADIEKASRQRSEDQAMADKQDAQARQEAEFQSYKANTGMRLSLFQRDLQKRMKKAAGVQKFVNNVNISTDNNDMLQAIFAKRVGRG